MKSVLNKYGPPDAAYFSKYCFIWNVADDFPWVANVTNTSTDLPLKRIYINRELKEKLFIAFTNLERAGINSEITHFDGCYNPRSVRGRNTTSLHAWAMAVDLNAEKEKLGQQNTFWSGRFIAIMKSSGLFWGGDWTSRKDSMHFALYNG